MFFIFVEEQLNNVEALRFLLDRKNISSSVETDPGKALVESTNNKRITAIVADPKCFGTNLDSFLQRADSAGVAAMMYDYLDDAISPNDYPGNIAQVIPRNLGANTTCALLFYFGRQIDKQQVLENRHRALSVSLGLEKELLKVVNLYSTILDISFNRTLTMIREYSRSNHVSLT